MCKSVEHTWEAKTFTTTPPGGQLGSGSSFIANLPGFSRTAAFMKFTSKHNS
jgi:hypothetical protein